MLQVSEALYLNFLQKDKELNLRKMMNEKKFTVSNAPFTYRQVNSLGEDNLLNDKRKDKKGWRRFSFKEIVYLLIVKDLKRFGFKHEQLRLLWDAFFAEPEKSKEKKYFKGVSESAIGCTFLEVEIILCVESNGELGFYDPNLYVLYFAYSKPHIQLVLNDYVNLVLKESMNKQIPVKWTLFSEHNVLKPQEENLLRIIRNEDYSEIKIKKKNGEINIIHAGKTTSTGLSQEDLLKIVNSKDFLNIEIAKRDGKIVNLKVEDTYKLSNAEQ